MVVVSLELAPMVDDEPLVVPELLPAVSVEGVVEALPLVVAPGLVLGVVAVEPVAAPAAGALLSVELLVPDDVPDDVCAHARPKVPAMAAAMTVMLNVR